MIIFGKVFIIKKIDVEQTRLQCVQLASVGEQLHWDSLPLKNKPSNLKQVQFFHANETYREPLSQVIDEASVERILPF